ncbi:MAG: chromosomal replication initiator protein DnaA [Acidimicrobiales bacterium]
MAPLPAPWTGSERAGPAAPPPPSVSSAGAGAHAPANGCVLDPRLSFESFVVGRSNRLAWSAARRVAQRGADYFNPLFIHGESGNGKTHLLHAIGQQVLDSGPSQEVRYVTSERLTAELITSVAGGRPRSEFSRRYRDCSLLLVDDVQFLEGKVETQTELFHTFDEITAGGGQVVLSADRHPGDIPTLPERLRSRFTSGLVADLEPPEFETRVAILSRKGAAMGVRVPTAVLALIASAVSRNVRELEGALTRVVADAGLEGGPLTPEGANASLSSFLGSAAHPVTSDRVIDEAAAVFCVEADELRGYSRSRGLVLARQAAMYVCRQLTDDSLPAIGRAFGGRDHTTVLHGVRKIEQLLAERRPVHAKVAELTSRLGARGALGAL